MEIDAFTFVAQILNFAVLVYLLRRFLYSPIQTAMKQREESIARQVEDAASERRSATELADKYRGQISELTAQRSAMIAAAEEDAERLAVELGAALKARIGAREQEWRASLDRRLAVELEDFHADVRREIISTMRTLLTELADEDMERSIRAKFLQHIDDLVDDELATLVGDAEHPHLTVLTGFALSPQDRAEIEARLREQFGDGAKLAFDVDETRIAGIELRCHGHRLGWSLNDALETLDAAVGAHVQQLTQEGAGANPPAG